MSSPDMWSKTVPNLPIAWDNTMFKALKSCPRKFYLNIVQHWRYRNPSPHLKWGLLYHAALENYHKQQADGVKHEDALQHTIWKLLEDSIDFTEDHIHAKTRKTLIRAVIWYLEEFRHDVAKTYIRPNGEPAVELSFRIELPYNSPDGSPYLYCGHMDRVVDVGGVLYVDEYKSTSSALNDKYFRQWTPNGQISGYTFAGRTAFALPVQGVMVDAVQTGVTFCRFKRQFINRTDEQLEEWLASTIRWIKYAEELAQASEWPFNEESCHHFSGCDFVEVCSKSPSVREHWLEDGFEQKEWNPLDNRSL